MTFSLRMFPGTQRTARSFLLDQVERLGVPYGREQAFKCSPGTLLRDRLLVGVQRASLDADAFFALAAACGMPEAAIELLAARFGQSNAVFLATEENARQRMIKVYLEFWDQVRARVLGGDTGPQLLHLGVKWSSVRPGHFEEAHYVCHPLLGLRDVLRRVRDVYAPGGSPSALPMAEAIVHEGARRRPDAGLLYLEAHERGNARHSYDINLYKTGLRVADVAAQLRLAASHFGIAPECFEPVLAEVQALPLGHLAGGWDRHGAEFLSVYAEVAPLPEAPARKN